MKLANRVLLGALAICVLSAVAFGQTPRGETDPRNLSPSVGTGGPEGGPTGLFTIYDGQTLRKGEFTFSFAFSNYDRDPGNADITDWPASFNVGLNDHLELFFKLNAYRGIKVNNPQNLRQSLRPRCSVRDQFIAIACPGPLACAMHERGHDRQRQDRLCDDHGRGRIQQFQEAERAGARQREVKHKTNDDRRQAEKGIEQNDEHPPARKAENR